MGVGRRRRAVAVTAIVTMLAMVAAGCAPQAQQPAENGAAGDLVEVKIGVSAPFTGDVAALGLGVRNGAQIAIEEKAPELEALGIRLTMLPVDDAADPETGVNAATQMVADPAVVGVVAHLNSGVSIPASRVYNEAGIVQISPASTNPALTLQGFENVFRVCTIDTVQGSRGAEFAFNELGFRTVAVIDDSTPYGEGLAAEFSRAFEELGGTVTSRDKIQLGVLDFKALVTRIAGDNPDFIYFGGMFTEGGLVSKQASDAGFEGPLMGGDGLYTQQFIDIAGADNAVGDFASSVGLPLAMQPRGQEFKTAFEAAFPGQEIEAYDTYAYDAAMVIIEAIKTVVADLGAAEVTSAAGKQAIIEAVAATQKDGVTGPISFDENGDTTNTTITIYTVRDGAWVPYAE